MYYQIKQRLLGVFFIGVMFVATPLWSQELSDVRILATGGTIAGAQSKPGEYGYKAGTFDVDALIKAVPDLDKLANVTGEQIVNIGSQDMNNRIWLKLAKRLNQVLEEPTVAGVVITHGTDTMEETGMFLNLVVKSDKPVIMTGSMRPATAISADGPMNLYNAVAAAVSQDAKDRGVLVSMNDELHYARDVTKTNTSSLQTFVSVNRGPAAKVNFGDITWLYPEDKPYGPQSEFDISQLDDLPRVDILYAHANMSVDLIDAAVTNGARGLVIAGVGDGNMTKEAIEHLHAAVGKGVAVVRSSHTGSGIIYRNNEIDDDKRGFVAADEFNPQKARVLLLLALTKTSDPKEIQHIFDKY